MAITSARANVEVVMAAGPPGPLITGDGVAVAGTLWTGEVTRPAIVDHHGFATNAMTHRVVTGMVDGQRALAAQARRIHQSPIAMAQSTASTLVVAGTDDVLARQVDRVAAAIPGARWQPVPGDHFDAVRQPALFEAVNDFLGA